MGCLDTEALHLQRDIPGIGEPADFDPRPGKLGLQPGVVDW